MRYSLAIAALAPVLSVRAADILVTVGGNNLLAFNPPNVTANVGDTINFQFQSKNHSVTQSTFANPCAIQTTPAPGIDSDFQPVSNTSAMVPQWSFVINATTPLWFFCKQTNPANHCQAGMVFSINAAPDGPKSYAVYKAAAMASADPAGAAAVESSASVAFATASAAGGAGGAGGASDSGASAPTSGAAGGAPGGASPTDSAAIGGATDGSNAVPSGLLSPSASASAGGSNKTNSAFRVGSGAVPLIAAVGITAMLL